jgi:hypothetical protein
MKKLLLFLFLAHHIFAVTEYICTEQELKLIFESQAVKRLSKWCGDLTLGKVLFLNGVPLGLEASKIEEHLEKHKEEFKTCQRIWELKNDLLSGKSVKVSSEEWIVFFEVLKVADHQG